MFPSVQVFDEALGGGERLGKSLLEILQPELCDQRLGRYPSSRAALVTSARKGGIAARTSFSTTFRSEAAFDVSLPKVHEVSARLHFACAPQVRFGHGDAVKQILPRENSPGRDDLIELERKGVSRALELLRQQEQRRIESVPRPSRLFAGGATIEVFEGEAFDDRARVCVSAEGGHILSRFAEISLSSAASVSVELISELSSTPMRMRQLNVGCFGGGTGLPSLLAG